MNLLCLRAPVSLPTPWHTTAKRQGWIPVLPNLLGGTQSEAKAAGGQWGKMGREQGRPIPSPACWVRSLSFGPWVPHLFCSLARSCPVLVLSLLLSRDRSVTFFLPVCLAVRIQPFPVLSLFLFCSQSLKHTPSDRLVYYTHIQRVLRAFEATCSLPTSFEYTRSFILIPFPPPEPGQLTRAVILSWLHSAPSSLDISELNPTRHCVPLDLTCKLTAPLFSHPSRLFLFLFSHLMK